MSTVWDTITPFHQLGLSPAPRAALDDTVGPGIARSAGPSATDDPKPWHPDNGLFWFGVIALVSVGLIAGATEVRVGPFRASASAGHK